MQKKNLSYQKQIDNLYQALTADCKKGIVVNAKLSKKLNTQIVKLNKALAASQKKLASAEKQNNGKAAAKSQIKKAQKICAVNEKAVTAAQQAIIASAEEAQRLKQALTQMTSEVKLIADSRIKKDSIVATAPKAKTKKAEKTKPGVIAEDENNEENQLALVMEEDFLTDDDESDENYS